MPRQLKYPQERDRLGKGSAGKHLIGAEQHEPEHYHKESQESVAEPGASQKFRRRHIAGQFQLIAQQSQELATAAIAVAVGLAASEYGDEQRYAEKQHAQPGEQYIEKS